MYYRTGTAITTGTIDPYGLCGREQHPPIDLPKGSQAVVVGYCGWLDGDGNFVNRDPFTPNEWAVQQGTDSHSLKCEWPMGTDNEDLFCRALYSRAAPTTDDDGPVHIWLCVVPGYGLYELADYEIASTFPAPASS